MEGRISMKVNLAKIRELRKARKISQEEIARKIGYKSGTGYHYIETGKRGIKAETLAKIAEVLNVSVEELYSDEERQTETA
jgi:transcriptional regulator with XRE-family HTH domain